MEEFCSCHVVWARRLPRGVFCVHISKQGEDGGLLFRCSQQITHTVEKHSRGLIRWSICKKEDVFGVRVEFKGNRSADSKWCRLLVVLVQESFEMYTWSTSKNNFLAPISGQAALATSPQLGRLQKVFNRISRSRANIVTSVTRNISKAWSTSKNSITFLSPIS